jgi:menaquinone-dependent protoporphyrinogen oxidase
MANVLILYATKEGQTEKIARRIAQTLGAEGHGATLVDADRSPESLDLAHYQALLIAAPIHAGGYPSSVVRFVRAHRERLERVRSVFLSVGLAVASRTSDGRAQTLAVVEQFAKKTGWHPPRVELVAGALPYSKYNFLIRFVMRRIAKQEGGDTDTSRDYEYTDWGAVDRLARELVPAASSSVTLRAEHAGAVKH